MIQKIEIIEVVNKFLEGSDAFIVYPTKESKKAGKRGIIILNDVIVSRKEAETRLVYFATIEKLVTNWHEKTGRELVLQLIHQIKENTI